MLCGDFSFSCATVIGCCGSMGILSFTATHCWYICMMLLLVYCIGRGLFLLWFLWCWRIWFAVLTFLLSLICSLILVTVLRKGIGLGWCFDRRRQLLLLWIPLIWALWWDICDSLFSWIFPSTVRRCRALRWLWLLSICSWLLVLVIE